MAEENNQEPLTFTPMSDAYAVPEEKKEIFNSDMDGIQSAAKELEETRAEKDDIVERRYVEIGGPDHGKPTPENHSIDLKRAVNDIQRQRDWEKTVAEHEGAQALAEATDQYRAEKAAEQQPQQQQQQQQAPEVQPQVSPEQLPPGVDPEIAEALTRSPKLRAAVEAELSKADQATQQFAQAAHVAAAAAVQSILADYPELVGLDGNGIAGAVQAMSISNPGRHQALTEKLQRAEQIHRMSEQAKSVQAEIMRQQINAWSSHQDQAFEQSVAHEPPETMKAVKENLVRVARDAYGLDPNELRQAFSEHPILRAAPFQKLIYSAVKAHLAQEQVAQKKIPASIPNVQRPGVAGDRPSGDEVETSRAYKKFIADPNPRSAAAFIMSKRGATRR